MSGSICGIEGGLQDHYAATFGGFNYIEFGERVVVNPLRINPAVINELELNLVLCYTGVSRESTNVISDQTARLVGGESNTVEGLRAQRDLAVAMKAALLRAELRYFGELLGEAWEQKKRLSPMISSSRIEEIYAEARRLGSVGGKVTGAGGGGHILFYCDFKYRHQLIEGLRQWNAISSTLPSNAHE